MNPNLNRLQPYPFEKLAKLKAGITPPPLQHIALSIGEPKHSPPQFVLNTLAENLGRVAQYPLTKGLPELRQAISDWASIRFKLDVLNADEHVLPVTGTREALFSFTQAVVDSEQSNAKVLMPNPFYQIYEGAAFLAGASPVYIPCEEKLGFQPNFDKVSEQDWKDCQLLFLCSPGNPTGAVLTLQTLTKLIELADKYDFIIASDECYSEIYFDEQQPPIGLLEACQKIGRNDYSRCVVFHSLSKRSNLPGLRSGFIAGDKTLIAKYLTYRTYHGCAMSVHTQLASIAAWQDESHVKANRDQYRAKFAKVIEILSDVLPAQLPDAGFYLWLKTPIDDETFAKHLFEHANITVLPGSYLSRAVENSNPGSHFVRMALVAELEECVEAAQRIKQFVKGHL